MNSIQKIVGHTFDSLMFGTYGSEWFNQPKPADEIPSSVRALAAQPEFFSCHRWGDDGDWSLNFPGLTRGS
jgi:hypothetical protein